MKHFNHVVCEVIADPTAELPVITRIKVFEMNKRQDHELANRVARPSFGSVPTLPHLATEPKRCLGELQQMLQLAANAP